MLRLLTTWRTLASDSRPGQACVRFGQDDCTMYTHCLRCMAWIALTNKMAETCVSYASARVSMSKICNRYLAKIDIWYIYLICDLGSKFAAKLWFQSDIASTDFSQLDTS